MSVELLRHQRLINCSMLVAVAVVMGRTAFLAVPEVFPWGAEVGDLVYDVGLAYATAWLFQWLVIVRPEHARRETVNLVMAPRVYDLVRPGRQLVGNVRGSTGRLGPGWPPRYDEWIAMCAALDTRKPPHQYASADYWPYLIYIQRRRAEAQSALEAYFDRMDEELLALIETERQAGGMLGQFVTGLPRPSNTSLEAFAQDLWGWLQAIESIRDYHDRVLAPGTYAPDEPY